MIDYHIDVARRLVTTRVAGAIGFGEFAAHIQRVYRDPKFSADYNALILAMDAAAMPTPATLALMKPLLRVWSLRRAGVKWAFVLPDRESRATAEMMLHEVKLTAVTTRCFTAEAAALAWLEAVAVPA